MRVVFDTNIYVSAFVIQRGLAEKAMLRVIEGEDALLISKDILDELLSTLARKFSRDTDELSRVAVVLTEMAETIKTESHLKVFKDDPDNRILECAADGRADLIVTGDKDMLQLKDYKGIKIISLRSYLEI